jgi:hypothetical protein
VVRIKCRTTSSVSNHSTRKNLTHNDRYNKTCKINRGVECNEVLESEINILVSLYNFIVGVHELNIEKSDNIFDVVILDDIIYEDMPGVLTFYVVNDDSESHSIED